MRSHASYSRSNRMGGAQLARRFAHLGWSESEEFGAKGVFVCFLGRLDLVAQFILFEMRLLPLVDFGHVVVDGSECFLLANCRYPRFYRVFVGRLQLIKFGMLTAHIDPRPNVFDT